MHPISSVSPVAVESQGFAQAQSSTGFPFQWALGDAVESLAPKVREHILQAPGTVVTYRGRVRVWRDGGWKGRVAGWLLRAGAGINTMFPETGQDIGFEMQHAVSINGDGSLCMTWIRTFHFERAARRFDALMRFSRDRGAIVDWFGARRCLQVELCPRVEGQSIVVTSRREWLCLGPLRISIPGWLKGRPHVREWQEPDGTLRIRVEIHNTILGHFFGYEGHYRRSQHEVSEPASVAATGAPTSAGLAQS